MPDVLDELQLLDREIEREWWWLNGALNALAQANAEGPLGRTRLLRDMHAQARTVDQRRLQIAKRIAELDRRVSR